MSEYEYSVDKIKEIPIQDVCNMLNITLNKQRGSNIWGNLRNEKTPSFSINPEKNIWRDWGTNEGGSVIDLVMKVEGVNVGKAIGLLGEYFNIPKENTNESNYNPLPTKNQFKLIGITSDRAIANFDIDLQKQSIEQIEELEKKYSISMNELSKSNPTMYHQLIDKKALPIIFEERNTLIDLLNKYSKAEESIDRALFKSQIEDKEKSLNEKIDIYNKSRLDSINKNSLKIKAVDRLPNEEIEINLQEVYTFDNKFRNIAKEFIEQELAIKVGDIYYNPTIVIDKENGNPIGFKHTNDYQEEDYQKLIGENKTDFINKFYLEPLYEELSEIAINNKIEGENYYTLAQDFHIWTSGTKINEIKNWFENNYTDFYLLAEKYPDNFTDNSIEIPNEDIENIESKEQLLDDELRVLENEINDLDRTINKYTNDLELHKGKYYIYSIDKSGDEALIGTTKTKKEAKEIGQDIYLKTNAKIDIKNLKDEISKLKEAVSNKRELFDVKLAEYKDILDVSNSINDINKEIGIDEEEPYRYYLTQRPPSIGTQPSGASNIVSFDSKQDFDGVNCYGYVEYKEPLSQSQIKDYELFEKNNSKEQIINPQETKNKEISQEEIKNIVDDIVEEINKVPLIDMQIDKEVDVSNIIESLKNGVGNIFNNESFIQYLNFQSQFYNYSSSNNLLIAMQNPNATNVASFVKWKSLGRTINKGEKGIMILAPNVVKNGFNDIFNRLEKYGKTNVHKYIFKKNNDKYDIYANVNNTAKLVRSGLSKNELESFVKINQLTQSYISGFRKTYVFDISQTSGEPVPEFKINKLNDNHLLDEQGFYKNPLIKVNISEGGVFKAEETLTFKQANAIFERKEAEVRELKAEYEAKGEYYPYLKQKFDIVLKPDSPISGVAKDIRVDIGDNQYNNLLEALKVEMKGFPEVFKTLKDTLNSKDNSMEIINGIKRQLENTIKNKNIELEYTPNTGRANGYFAPAANKICVNSEMSLSQQTKTLLHEYVHSQLHNNKQEKKDTLQVKQTIEIEAEATAYVVSKHFGFDTSKYSFDYVSAWARGKEMSELGETLKSIKEASEKIINELKAPLELELYNNKENITEILKAQNVTPNTKIINNLIDINKETGKLNSVTDLKNAEKFNIYNNIEINSKISDLNKEIITNTVIVEEKTVSIEMER